MVVRVENRRLRGLGLVALAVIGLNLLATGVGVARRLATDGAPGDLAGVNSLVLSLLFRFGPGVILVLVWLWYWRSATPVSRTLIWLTVVGAMYCTLLTLAGAQI